MRDGGLQGWVRVWDPFVRIAHGVLALGFAIAWLTEGKPAWLHEWAGYAVGATVALRVAWGFVGPREARFATFVGRPSAALTYLRRLIAFRAPRFLGHSPAGGIMVVALLASLAVTTATGVAYLGASRDRGPLAPLLGAEAARLQAEAAARGQAPASRPARWLKQVHEGAADITLLLVIAHVGGVALASLAHRENLPRAMLTGRKRAPDA
ncbi:MAG: cytochrome b/b6 domain-containing protein [Alphaproteobacteria bacterium]|jgi:cytochrome b